MTAKPQPGDRVRITDTCVWPERRGLFATVMAPPADGTYPQPAPWEVLLRVDDDPLVHRAWSCVMPAKDTERVVPPSSRGVQ